MSISDLKHNLSSLLKWENIYAKLSDYGLRFLSIVLIIFVGFWLISKGVKLLESLLNRRKIDITLTHFLITLFSILLKVLVVITAISTAGINTASFIAILGAVGLAVAMSLQGSLSNFAGGVLILVFKPFRVDDFIQSKGFTGYVEHIDIFHTILLTPDKRTVILPNGQLSNDAIINFTRRGYRRVEIALGVAYNTDMEKARIIIKNTIDKETNIIKEQPITVEIKGFGENSLDLAVYCFASAENYWETHYRLHESIKKALDKNHIEIPFPQRVVYTNHR